MADELQLVIFQVGRKTLALPLQEVEHILSLVARKAGRAFPPGRHDPVPGPGHSLAAAVGPPGGPSVFREFDELAQTLPRRRQGHLDWMAALEQSLRHDIPFTKAHNPRVRLRPVVLRLPHRGSAAGPAAVPVRASPRPGPWPGRSAARPGGSRSAGGGPGSPGGGTAGRAGGTAGAVRYGHYPGAYFERPLALILNDSGQRTALGVDRVLDIRSVTAADVHPARGRLGSLVPQAASSAIALPAAPSFPCWRPPSWPAWAEAEGAA